MARREKGALRAEILQATIALLQQAGDPERVSVDDVVTAVGCTPPALYYYFPTKAQLVIEACQVEYAAFAADLDAATGVSDDPLADVRRRGEAYLAWARAHPVVYRHLFMTPLGLHDPDAGAGASVELPDFHDIPGLGGLVRDLERVVAAGHDIGDPSMVAFALWGVVHGFASLSVTEPDIPDEFLVSAMQLAARGLVPSGTGAGA